MPAKTEKDATIIEYAKTLAHTPWCDDYEKMISGVLYGRNLPLFSIGFADNMGPDTTRWLPS